LHHDTNGSAAVRHQARYARPTWLNRTKTGKIKEEMTPWIEKMVDRKMRDHKEASH